MSEDQAVGSEQAAKQNQMISVAFQGERGAYGEEAVVAYFGDSERAQPVPCRTLSDVFQRVVRQEVNLGLVPVENSQAGSINETYDLLRQYDLSIVGEHSLRVNHHLLALPDQGLDVIKRAYSHPQALAQCELFLREHGIEAVANYDTAGSAQMIAQEELKGAAAIASRRAAELYGLEVLASGIETMRDNYTRFLALGPEPAPRGEGPQKTALVLATAHRPGALYECLGALAKRDISLEKLESRPSRSRPFEYVFYLDFEGHREDPPIREALADLAGLTLWMKVLGSFPRG